jgi:hypothetical protein
MFAGCCHFILFVQCRTLGALSLYSREAHAFTESSGNIGRVFAQHAAVAMFAAAAEGQFRTALASRDVIGQAKGMLMERYGIDAADAFKLLKRLSQENNTLLRHVAQQVIENPTPLAGPSS